MNIAKGAVYFLLILSTLKLSAQQLPYPTIGFRTITTYDSSRLYRPNVPTSDPLHHRPVEMDLWYPAEVNPSDTIVKFYDLIQLLEKRSAFFGNTTKFNGLSDELIQYICAGFDCKNPETLKSLATKSYLNAKPVAEKFPLVVYLTAFNGMSYENFQLFEALAHQGFIVVSISSIGRYPGNMSLNSADLFEQVRDATFSIKYLASKDLVTQDYSLLGYSWGGLAASVMAMTPSFQYRAIISLDGSEQFNYGNEEDIKNFTQIRESGYFKPQKIQVPYLYLDQDFTSDDDIPDSVYAITDHIRNSYYLKIIGASHTDFSCLSNISRQDSTDDNKYKLIQNLITHFLLDRVKGSNDFEAFASKSLVSKTFSLPKIDAINSGKTIKGIVRDVNTNATLPYVNIGIPGKGIGTATDLNGKFSLTIPVSFANDTLKFSMVGYEEHIINLHNWPRNVKMSDIRLKERISELREVVVPGDRLTTKVLGNKTQSKFFGGKFASNDLGSELAIRIKIKKAVTFLESFYVNISYNTSDSSTFRLNIYEVKNGLPGRNILTENILFQIGRQSGKIEFDLSKYDIIVKDDFFVSLEWIDGNKNSGIVFSGGFTNKNTFYRKASQGKWKKHQLGVGFNVKVIY